MLIMIFTPLLFYLIKSKIFYPLLIFLLIVGMKFQFAFSLSFFLIGASFSINKTNLDFKINNKLLLLVLLLLSVFLGVYLTVKGPITNLNFYFSIIPLLLLWFGYDYIVIKGTTFKFLDKMLPFTFFIYCFHEPSINIFKKTLVYLGNKSEFSYFFTYLISPILMVFLCYVIGNFLKNIMPKAFSVITGNRI